MAGSRSGSQGTEARKGDKRQAPSQRPEADLAPAPQASELPHHLLADGQGGQVDLLSNPEIPSVQRQRFATQIGRTQGNRHLQQVIERVSRRIATVARDPWDEPVPAGQNVPGSLGPGAIPPDLLQSVDLSTLSLDELRDRLDRIMETLIQVAHNSPDAEFLEGQAIRIRQLLTEREVEETVQHELESFLEEFQNITVTVRWGEDTGGQSVQHSEEVAVHPPYFMNVMRRARGRAHRRTLERYDAARAHRRAADRATWQLLSEISRREGRRGGMGAARARVGKSRPEDIQRILQRALDRNLIQGSGGRDHPNSADLRNWLIRYGIGVDCSAFVSQALNRVTAALGGESENLRRGSGGLSGRARGFSRVTDPAELRPGDTMYKPGHIRIITSVRRDPSGDVTFSTAESRAGDADDPGGDRADVGPGRAEWRYHNGQLQKRRSTSDPWVNSSERPTFGRYRRLATEMAGAASVGSP